MSYNLSTAFLSSLVYEDSQVNANTNGHIFVDPAGYTWTQRVFLSDSASGYQGAVFVNSETHQVVMANRGTELSSGADLVSDLQMGIGRIPSQYNAAITLLEEAQTEARNLGYSSNDVLVTGHSLGGSVAQLLGAANNLATETYNAYGVGNLLSDLGITGTTFDTIVNHVTDGDPVSVFPGSKMLGSTDAYTTPADAFWAQYPLSPETGGGLIPAFMGYLFDAHGIGNFMDTALAALAGRAVRIDVPPSTVAVMIAWSAQLGAKFLNSALGMSKVLDGLLGGLYDRWGNAEQTRSPLTLDLDGDGVETLNKTAGVHFDHDGSGFAENTGWVGKDDGLLVRDLDSNGKIETGAELFGDHTVLRSGALAANGFAALADLDSNGDGVVDQNDSAWSTLKVWKDANSDGITDAGELISMQTAGVRSISVGYTNNGEACATDAANNQHRENGSYTSTDGTTRNVDDVWFGTTNWDTVQRNPVAVSATIAALPELAGAGNLASLHQAMAQDASGQLQVLVGQYVQETDPAARDALLQDILYHWAGVQDIDPASRSATQIYGNAIGDARKLAFLEHVFGEGYLGTWCWGERDPNPHGPAAVKLLALYEDLKGYLRAELDAQSCFKGDYDALSVTWNADTASFALDVSGVVSGLRREYAADAATTLEHLDALGSDLRRLGASGLDFLLALQSEGNAQGDAFAQALSTVGTVGTVGLVFNGTAGDDILVGNDADNYFHGLAGNDLMQGGEGNDTYYFNRGDGQDTILDLGESSQDSVRFGAGILASQVSVSRGTDSGCDDLILDLGSGDRLKPANDFCYIAPPQRPACAQALMH